MTKDETIKIYQQHFESTYYAALRIVKDPQQAEDLCQDIFLSLYESPKKFNHVENKRAYLRRMATNSALRYNKSIVFEAPLESQLDLSNEEEETNYWGHLTSEAILEAMTKLSPGYKVILEKHLLDDLSLRQISEDLNISDSTCRSQYLRGKKQLRKIIDRHE